MEIQRFKQETRREAKELFAKSSRAKSAHNIDPLMPSAGFAKLIMNQTQTYITTSAATNLTRCVKKGPVENREGPPTPTCAA